jgi:hypothetical protein
MAFICNNPFGSFYVFRLILYSCIFTVPKQETGNYYCWKCRCWNTYCLGSLPLLQDMHTILSSYNCIHTFGDPGGRAVWGVGLRPLPCRDCGFKSLRVHACLSLVSGVYCQLEVSALGWSLVQRSPTDCGVLMWSWSHDNGESLAH